MSRFHHSAIEQFTEQQVQSAPEAIRLDQLDRAESVIATLEPGTSYRFQDLAEQVTNSRPRTNRDLMIDGADAAHDLSLFVEELSESSNMPADLAGEPVLTVDDVSQQYNVSTKTVDRWRKRGLVSRRFQFGNRSRVGFLKSSIDRFVRSHENEIARGSRFSQLSIGERGEIVEAGANGPLRKLSCRGESQPCGPVQPVCGNGPRRAPPARRRVARSPRVRDLGRRTDP